MKNLSDLKRELEKIDGRGYKTYKTLEGQYSFEDYILSIDHVQGDPFASPSRIRVIVNSNNNFPKNLFDEKYKKITICDFLTRLFSKNIYKYGEKVFGSGKSGLIEISKCSQQVIERTSIIINNEKIEARFYVGFPARGRSVLSKELEKILFNIIPNIVKNTLIYNNINIKALNDKLKLLEDQEFIRKQLKDKKLIAFIANNSILPEDGRAITKTDISLFINNLPNGKDTKKFYTENASGSTSQAANIIEGIESGTKLFLIDEDTSATNFMIRDSVMQQLVSKDKEPITPFIDVARSLYKQKGISTILVAGSSGDFFDIADLVIQMDNYEPYEVTKKAKALSRGITNVNENLKVDIDFNRVILKGTIESSPKGVKVKTLGKDGISINKENIDLRAVEQIVDNEQLNTIGAIMKYAENKLMGKNLTLAQIADNITEELKNNLIGIENIKGGYGSFAIVRKQEIMCVYNRYRKIKIR